MWICDGSGHTPSTLWVWSQDTPSILLSKLTKVVQNVSNEDKLAGVELDDLRVDKQLGALQNTLPMN